MTLAELIGNGLMCAHQFNNSSIPLKYKGRDVEITFDPAGSNDTGWVINLQIEQK